MTTKAEATITQVYPEPEHRKSYASDTPSVRSSYRFGAYKLKGKRKEFYLDFKPCRTLVVPGWDHLERECDAYNRFSINACLNLAGTPEQVRELVALNINSNFTDHDILIAVPEAGQEILVYPESDTEHAVIRGIRDREEVA